MTRRSAAVVTASKPPMRTPPPTRDGRAVPIYELRATAHGAGDLELEVWQLPAAATPGLKAARRIAGLRGRNLGMIENRLLKQLKATGIDPTGIKRGDDRRYAFEELPALRLGLLFRLLAPMRSRAHIRACADGVEAMGREEAAYWLGMAMHRKYPRRVLMALRFLLIDPKLA